MGNIDVIKERIGDSIKVKELLLTNDHLLDTVSNLADEIVACISHGGKLVICGNGGQPLMLCILQEKLLGDSSRNVRLGPLWC